MGIRLEIAGDNSEQFSQALHGVFGLLKMYPSPLADPAVGIAGLQIVPETGDVVAEAGPNPSLTEQPKRRGRPAKPSVTIEGVVNSTSPTDVLAGMVAGDTLTVTVASVKPEEGATSEPRPTATAATPLADAAALVAPTTAAKKPTIDEARTALKAIAALPNGQELGYSVLAKMSVKNVTEAYLKNAEQFMALCAETLAAATVAA